MDQKSVKKTVEVCKIEKSLENVENFVKPFLNIRKRVLEAEAAITAKVNDLKTDVQEFYQNPEIERADGIIDRYANLVKLVEEVKHLKLFDVSLNQDFLRILSQPNAIAQYQPQVVPAPIKAHSSTITRFHNSTPSPNADNYKIKKRFVSNQLNITAKVLNAVSSEEFYVRNLAFEAEDDEDEKLASIKRTTTGLGKFRS